LCGANRLIICSSEFRDISRWPAGHCRRAANPRSDPTRLTARCPRGEPVNALMRLTAVLLLPAAATAALAQDYPTRPIRMIVPLRAGSGADIAGRIVGKYMSDAWQQPVVIENRPGAGGQIGTQAVIKSDADGHTLLVQSASHAANSAIYKSLPYDPLKDLV